MKDVFKEKNLQGRVLIVDDDKTSSLLMTLFLEKKGLEVTLADNGMEVLEKLKTDSFDLILMDIQLPEMDGYQITRNIRKRGIKTPIVAITAYAMKGVRKKCLAAGCDDYLAKPVTKDKFIKVISGFLNHEPIKIKVDA